jgi:multidrug resistance efflux pump
LVSDFARSFGRLQADGGSSVAWALLLAACALAAWLSWAVFARISLYEISSDARVELDGATFPLDAPFSGRIVVANLRVGEPVRRGDLLVEIDAMPVQLQLQEERVQIEGLDPQFARLRSQIDAELGARSEEERGLVLIKAEAAGRMREAEIPAQFAEQELARIRKLYSQQLVSTHDLEKAESEAGRLHSAMSALQAASSRVPQLQAERNRERDVRIARLEGEVATLEARRETLRAEIARLGYEADRRKILAPVDGRIGEAEILRIGAVVAEGNRLGSVVPTGHLLVVAQYPAQAAFGRIRAGQHATLRLEGFPWAEFGTVSATVQAVAQEIRNGKVRVELAIAQKSSFRGALEHGMPGTLEVGVDRISPLALTLRTAGQWLTQAL